MCRGRRCRRGACSQQNNYGPPVQGYGPPVQGYGPPMQGYGPPIQGYGPPNQGYGPPNQNYGPQGFGPFGRSGFRGRGFHGCGGCHRGGPRGPIGFIARRVFGKGQRADGGIGQREMLLEKPGYAGGEIEPHFYEGDMNGKERARGSAEGWGNGNGYGDAQGDSRPGGYGYQKEEGRGNVEEGYGYAAGGTGGEKRGSGGSGVRSSEAIFEMGMPAGRVNSMVPGAGAAVGEGSSGRAGRRYESLYAPPPYDAARN